MRDKANRASGAFSITPENQAGDHHEQADEERRELRDQLGEQKFGDEQERHGNGGKNAQPEKDAPT